VEQGQLPLPFGRARPALADETKVRRDRVLGGQTTAGPFVPTVSGAEGGASVGG